MQRLCMSIWVRGCKGGLFRFRQHYVRPGGTPEVSVSVIVEVGLVKWFSGLYVDRDEEDTTTGSGRMAFRSPKCSLYRCMNATSTSSLGCPALTISGTRYVQDAGD